MLGDRDWKEPVRQRQDADSTKRNINLPLCHTGLDPVSSAGDFIKKNRYRYRQQQR
jgi:hypothetical protein